MEGDNVTVSDNDTVSGGEGTSSRIRRELQEFVSYVISRLFGGQKHSLV